MPKYRVSSPDGATWEVDAPEGASEDAVIRYAQSQWRPAQPKPQDAIGEAQANPEASVLGMKLQGETGSGFNPAAALISAGRFGDKLNQGYEQAKTAAKFAVGRLLPGAGAGTGALDQLMAQKEAETEKDRQFAKLETVHPGSAQIGQIAPLAPIAPAAMLAASALEYGSPQERAMRVGATVAGNKLATAAGRSAAGKVDDLAASRTTNAVRDANIQAAKEAGYKALPSEAGGNLAGRILEGGSGQIKAKQAMQVANQPITDAIAKSEAGMPASAELTYQGLKEARASAYAAGYEPLKALWGDKVRLKPSATYKAELSAITSRADAASKSFGELVKSDTAGLIDKAKSAKPFTVDEALSTISIMREKASDLYRAGNADAGKVSRKIAEAVENDLERHLSGAGQKDLLAAYRSARKTIAKNFDVEAALVEGQGVNAQKLAAMYRKSPEKFSGGLRTIARAGSSLKDSTHLPKQGGSLPISALDTYGMAAGQLAAGATSFLTGNPLPMLAPAGLVAGRVGARKAITSGAGQRAFTNPDYAPGLLLRGERALLDNEFAPQLGGLLGYYGVNR